MNHCVECLLQRATPRKPPLTHPQQGEVVSCFLTDNLMSLLKKKWKLGGLFYYLFPYLSCIFWYCQVPFLKDTRTFNFKYWAAMWKLFLLVWYAIWNACATLQEIRYLNCCKINCFIAILLSFEGEYMKFFIHEFTYSFFQAMKVLNKLLKW